MQYDVLRGANRFRAGLTAVVLIGLAVAHSVGDALSATLRFMPRPFRSLTPTRIRPINLDAQPPCERTS